MHKDYNDLLIYEIISAIKKLKEENKESPWHVPLIINFFDKDYIVKLDVSIVNNNNRQL